MDASSTVDVLNRLLGLHSRSLPMYLASARPWIPAHEAESLTALRHIADDQQLMADRLGSLIMQSRGVTVTGEFPMIFTDMHDLSMDYLLPKLIEWQANDIGQIQQCITALNGAPEAKAVAEEALGAAQAHLQSLSELQQVSSN